MPLRGRTRDSQISELRAEQKRWQSELADAEQAEVEALGAEQQARDTQRRAQRLAVEARTKVHALARQIDQLLEGER